MTKFKTKTNLFLTKDDKVDLIKWMVGLWISGIGLLITLIKFI